jgi:hypothetical protein
MAPSPTFRTGLKIATEASRGTAPTNSLNPHWSQGGRWMDVITDGLPQVYDQQAVIFPPGHAGKRSMNQQPPVVGRKWTEGEFTANVVADVLGLFLHAAMGGLSSNGVRSAASVLLTAEALNSASKSLVLVNQPSDSGAVLQILISGTSLGGTISLSGIDAYGNGASETITYTSAGSFYTRTSFSSIAASNLHITSQNLNGSVTINGYKYWEHTFSASDQNPTYSIEKLGDPTAGAASRSFVYPAMVLRELTLNTPADTPDGIFQANTSWEGDPSGASTSTTINDASAMRIWPAWTLAISRDGSSWYKVTNQSLTINSGNRNYRAAAGVQGPQGSFFGAREVTGSFDILVDNEVEFKQWQGSSRTALHLLWDTDWKLTSSQDMRLSASLTDCYLESNSTGENDGAYQLSMDFRTIAGSDDVFKAQLRAGTPHTAYGSPLS